MKDEKTCMNHVSGKAVVQYLCCICLISGETMRSLKFDHNISYKIHSAAYARGTASQVLTHRRPTTIWLEGNQHRPKESCQRYLHRNVEPQFVVLELSPDRLHELCKLSK